LKNFVFGLKVVNSVERPLKIFCDNSIAIFFSKNNKSGSRSKHIDIKFLVVRQDINRELVSIKYINIEFTIVDPLKGLSAKVF